MSKRLIFALLILVAGAQGVLADEFHVGDLVVKQAWARATIGLGKTGAAYLTVTNRGDKADRLIAVETPIARRASLHTHILDGDVIKMRPVEAVEIAPGQSATFKPGGDHIMMMGLKRPLKKGGTFRLTLNFEATGSVAIMVDIANATAKAPGGAHDHGAHDQGNSAETRHDQAKHNHSKLINMPAGPAAPDVDIEVTKDSVGGWNLHIETTNFRFAPDHASGTHQMGEGHAHLYINGKKIARIYGPAFHIGSLPKGMNKVTVTLNGNDHRGLAVDGVPVSKTIEVHADAMAH